MEVKASGVHRNFRVGQTVWMPYRFTVQKVKIQKVKRFKKDDAYLYFVEGKDNKGIWISEFMLLDNEMAMTYLGYYKDCIDKAMADVVKETKKAKKQAKAKQQRGKK